MSGQEESMVDTIVHQGPGFTIAISDEPMTLVPYGPAPRLDNYNHGWTDIRDQPELVSTIPEASKSEGLAAILRAFNSIGSQMMTIGCECGLFVKETTDSAEPRYFAGGYIDVAFRDAEKNGQQILLDFAGTLLRGISAPPSGTHISYEMIVQPLKHFFGTTGLWCLQIKPAGHGDTDEQAWHSFNYAANAIADSFTHQMQLATKSG